RRYDLAKVGRYKLNRKLGLEQPMTTRTLTNEDLVKIVARIVELNNGKGSPDDIDHLGNRRVRAVGELIQSQFRVGLLRMERVVRERMSIVEPEKATPKELINIRPVVAAIKEFFGGSQLSQFMQQTNPLDERVQVHRGAEYHEAPPSTADFMDVSPKQIVSVSAALIPFLEHDDANRALMGSNMQRQAVPVVRPEAPIIGTGIEYRAARDSGQVVVARAPGVVRSVSATEIWVEEEALADLDENGIVYIGAEVGPQDILVGKITPKGETELTAEERLLRAIFGEKAREVKDTSLRLPSGEHGKVVDVAIFSRENNDE